MSMSCICLQQKLTAKLSIEGTGTDADIVVGLESAYMHKVDEHMADVSQYSHLEYLDDMSVSNGKYLIWERQAGSVIVNKKILERENLPMPKTYEDLLNPVYKNYIAMPDQSPAEQGSFSSKV